MPFDWTVYACLALGIAAALVAGVFQSFSDFVMRSLAAARPESGAEAMQMINREVKRSAFVTTLLGLAPATALFAIYAALTLPGAAAGWSIAGASVYLGGVVLVTGLANVPMNERLDRQDPASREGAAYWAHYGRRWTRWNHVRTLGSAVTALCFLLAALALA